MTDSQLSIEQTLQQAATHQAAQQWREAEWLYQAILQVAPRHPDANHNFGILSAQLGEPEKALRFLETALDADPTQQQYWLSYIEVLLLSGRHEVAKSVLELGVQKGLSGKSVDELTVRVNEPRREPSAKSSATSKTSTPPPHAPPTQDTTNRQRARTKSAQRKHAKVAGSNKRAPDLFDQALLFHKAGRLDEAVRFYRQVLSINPANPPVLNNLGAALQALGKLEDALESYQSAIISRPNYAEAHSNLGNTLKQLCRLAEAEVSCKRALEIRPDFAEAHGNLGNALLAQGKLDEAIVSYRRVLSLKPHDAESHHNLGMAFHAQGKLDEAHGKLLRAIDLKAGYAEAHCNLGIVLKAQGKLEEAIACYQEALAIKPDYATANSNLLLAMQYAESVTPDEVYREHRRYADRFEFGFSNRWQNHQNFPDPERKLKVGYVSGDFFNHAVAFFIEPILASHDKSQVEIYCYYNNTKHDKHTDRIISYADHWLAVAGLSDDKLAERIRTDGIDILVDLSGHTAHNRLPVFARKPAPIQATWIGYAGTTGLTAMDYRITDAYMDPPGGTERYHSEALVRLPGTGTAYRPEPGCPLVTPLPALNSAAFTLASLNNLTKINQSVANLWGRILNTLPNARLMLGNVTEDGIQKRLFEMFGNAGVAADRLILLPRMPLMDYLKLHQNVDLALDPFPYNGGTTTIHSLWMGVPVITLAGENVVSRVGVTLMSRVGLNEFITYSEDEYLERTVQFAKDLTGLDRIRQSLRERMSRANGGHETITRHLETAYRQMWQKWCASRPKQLPKN